MSDIGHVFACLCLAIVLCSLGGCRNAPPPQPPALVSGGSIFVGTPVSGPVEGAPDVSAALTTQVHVRWIALRTMPSKTLPPVNTQSRLIMAPDSEMALPASGDLTRVVRFGTGATAATFVEQLHAGDLGLSSEIGSDSRLVVPGATALLGVQAAGASTDAEPLVALLVSPHVDGAAATRPAEAAIGVRITTTASVADSDLPARTVRETAVVDAVPFADGSQFVVAVPLRGPPMPWTALAAIATVTTAAPEPAAITDLQAALEQASQQVKAGLEPSPLGDGPALRSALAALRNPDSIRPAMLLLTNLSNARVAGDMALVADRDRLEQLAQAVREYIDPDAVPALPDLRWFLDRTALQSMCESAEKQSLPPELQSVLTLHAGDVARRPDAILELLKQVGNSDALADRLIAENIIALEDSSPAARARAYDWLVARDRAPAGFDPFADARSRRAAIDQAMNDQGGQP